ncbi:MAG: hypothetical protein AB7F86_12570 [Bdellovibrionales bacterium]
MTSRSLSVPVLSLAALLGLGFSFSNYAAASCASAVQSGMKKCQSKSSKSLGDADPGVGMSDGANDLMAKSFKSAGQNREAQRSCNGEYDKCKQACKGAEAQKCEELKKLADQAGAGADAAEKAGQAAGQTGGASGMNPMSMMGPLMEMLKKKQEEDKKKEEEERKKAEEEYLRTHAYNPYTGQIDCAKPDGFQYAACDAQYKASCANAMSDPRCQGFSARYCAAGGAATYESYCRTVANYNFCNANTNRGTCPACLQLASGTGVPGGNSTGELAKYVANKPECAGDPVAYGDAAVVAALQQTSSGPIGGGAVVGGPGPGTGGNLPVAVLPGGGTATGGTGATGGGGTTPPGVVLPGGGTGGTGGGTGGTTGGTGIATASVHTSYSMSSVSDILHNNVGGPATDVQGQYGPSLFTTGSAAIQQRCEAGQLYCY